MRAKWLLGILVFAVIVMGGCTRDEKTVTGEVPGSQKEQVSPRGIGPVTKVDIGPIDRTMAEKGRSIFEQKCAACHHLDERFVGPAIRGVTKRRTPEWIMNMILNPVEMTQKDPVARELLATHLTQMTFQNVTEPEARAVLEYFRTVDEGGA